MRNVLISGAGIAGPTLAVLLQRQGYRVTIVESAPQFRTGGYMIDFWGAGYDVAERLSLLPRLRADGYRINEVDIVDARGKRVAGFNVRVMDEVAHGRYFSIQRGDLARAIYDLLPSDTTIYFGTNITALEQQDDGVKAEFDRAPSATYDLVFGADGLHSNVRRLIFGQHQDVQKFLGYYAAAFTTDVYAHRDEHSYVTLAIPGGQIARYALRGGRSAFFMIIATGQRLRFGPHDTAAQKHYLRETFRDAGWESRSILDAMERAGDFYFDEVTQVQMQHWTAGRIALLGDAAYCPSLLSGQGSALAMAGAWILAAALAHHDNHHAAFQQYESTFKPFMARKQKAAQGFAPWFAPRTALGVRLRNMITNALNIPVIGPWLLGRPLKDDLRLPV